MENGPSNSSEPSWLKSTFCQRSSCVEVSRQGDYISIRRTQEPETIMRYTTDEWAAFAQGFHAGEFDHLLDH
jgi:Domain of unknown function (DUF397)